jgi:hypothetical protein
MAHAERPIAFLPNYLARDLKITRASPHPRKDGIARTTPQNRYSIGQTLCDVGSAITSRINRTVCVMNAPSKIVISRARFSHPISLVTHPETQESVREPSI